MNQSPGPFAGSLRSHSLDFHLSTPLKNYSIEKRGRGSPSDSARDIPLQPGHFLQLFRIASTFHLDLRRRRVDLVRSPGVSSTAHRSDVFFQSVQLCRAGNRHDPRLLRQQPRQRDLRRGCVLALRNRCPAGRSVPGSLSGLRGKAGQRAAEIGAVELRVWRPSYR